MRLSGKAFCDRSNTYHLYILETDGGVNSAVEDGLGGIHSNSDRGVVLWLHAKVACQPCETNDMSVWWPPNRYRQGLNSLVDLDLAKLANITDLLATEALEIRSDATAFDVDDASSGLIHERSNRGDGIATHTLCG